MAFLTDWQNPNLPPLMLTDKSAIFAQVAQGAGAASNTIYNLNTNDTINKTTIITSKESSKISNIAKAAGTNILHSYRSYNYIFTLAALKGTALSNPTSYKNNQDYVVIAKSGGKGTEGMKSASKINSPTFATTSDAQNNQDNKRSKSISDLTSQSDDSLIENFNQNSSGRFDFYINNVHIETIAGGSEKSGMSVATKIEFEILEPYSMTGFIEALQVSAVATGHDSYINCPYLLKMEFIGYPDGQGTPNPVSIPNSTRYFIMAFTGIDVDVTETGARYKCQCVPHNEKALGEPAVLKNNINFRGTKVGTILRDFIQGVNVSIKQETKDETNTTNLGAYDEYDIIFPMHNIQFASR